MRPLIALVDLLLWCLQGFVMLVLVVPFQRAGQALTWFSWRVLIPWVYYRGVVLTRRRITGGPLWRDSDLMLGITPPESELERLMKIPPPPGCL